MYNDSIDTVVIDDVTDFDTAADTLRFVRLNLDEAPTDPDATSIYDITPTYFEIQRASAARSRLIRDTRQSIESLRDAVASGWDVGLELAHEERQLVTLLGAA